MSKCPKFEDILARYVHGGVLLQEREDLEEHLSVCASCERLYRDVAVLELVLREMPEKIQEAPSYLKAKILANLEDAPHGTAWRRWRRWATVLGSAAACALVAVVLYRGDVRKESRVASVEPPARASGTAPASKEPETKVAVKAPEKVPKPREAKPAATGDAAAVAPKVQVIREVRIYFYYPNAARVAVTGDFNGWKKDGAPLKPTGKVGLWETTLRLSPGAYSYNFIVDGNFLLPDPNAPDQMPDGYGGTNSILLIKGGNSV